MPVERRDAGRWVSPCSTIRQLVFVVCGECDSETIRRERRSLRRFLIRLRVSSRTLGRSEGLQSNIARKLQSRCVLAVLSKTLGVQCSAAEVAAVGSHFPTQTKVLASYLEMCGADQGLATFESLRKQWRQFVLMVVHGQGRSGEVCASVRWRSRRLVREISQMRQHFTSRKRQVNLRLSGTSGRYSMAMSAINKLLAQPFEADAEIRAKAIWNALHHCEIHA